MKQNLPRHSRFFATLFGLLMLFKVMLLIASGDAAITGTAIRNVLSSVISGEKIVELTNQERALQGMKQLKVSGQLQAAAQRKAEDMLAKQYFSHTTPDKKTPWDFLNAQKYYFLYAGENLAMRFNSSERVVESWMESTAHKENILNRRFTEIGIGTAYGVYQGEPTIIVVQMFGRPFKTPVQAGLTLAKKGRADVTETVVAGSQNVNPDELSGDEASDVSPLKIFQQAYFYIVLLLLANVVFRFIYLQHYRDLQVTFYTAGVFLFLLSTITLI